MSRTVGYSRALVAGGDVQADAAELEAAGADEVFTDDASADPRSRPGLEKCLRSLRPGDTLLVTSAARLSHSLGHFVSTHAALTGRDVAFRSLSEPALSSGGRRAGADEVLVALEGLRRRLISLRTRRGMDLAAAVGRRGGRPTVMDAHRVAVAQELRAQGRSFAQIARVLEVSASAVQRALSEKTVPKAQNPASE